jgi:hypothetical protein
VSLSEAARTATDAGITASAAIGKMIFQRDVITDTSLWATQTARIAEPGVNASGVVAAWRPCFNVGK